MYSNNQNYRQIIIERFNKSIYLYSKQYEIILQIKQLKMQNQTRLISVNLTKVKVENQKSRFCYLTLFIKQYYFNSVYYLRDLKKTFLNKKSQSSAFFKEHINQKHYLITSRIQNQKKNICKRNSLIFNQIQVRDVKFYCFNQHFRIIIYYQNESLIYYIENDYFRQIFNIIVINLIRVPFQNKLISKLSTLGILQEKLQKKLCYDFNCFLRRLWQQSMQINLSLQFWIIIINYHYKRMNFSWIQQYIKTFKVVKQGFEECFFD
ncbi:unnamed protein product [Paramecium pentaurelia]|uniref:Uncharacterized protein n=1 Tax=Paramecium pentaurelia TaxID=43138 RepID=A0A8S1XNA0_9CILI|nr:unnamed protein product [Paramecium pentaurelia]